MADDKALDLWKRFFEWTDDPYIQHVASQYCYFCGEEKPTHELDCIYLAAKELVASDEKGEDDRPFKWPEKSPNVHDMADRYRK